MALAVRSAQLGRNRSLARWLLLTMLLGACFLGLKGFEYSKDIDEHLVPGGWFRADLPPPAQMFWVLYWLMTGLHSLHVLVGLGVLSVITFLAKRNVFSPEYHTPVEISGLYWHFVDLVWIFLYPLLYLVNRSS